MKQKHLNAEEMRVKQAGQRELIARLLAKGEKVSEIDKRLKVEFGTSVRPSVIAEVRRSLEASKPAPFNPDEALYAAISALIDALRRSSACEVRAEVRGGLGLAYVTRKDQP
jgi:hypothetical protein